MIEFKDLKIGDQVYILENIGTFRRMTTFNIGRVISIGLPYDDTSVGNAYLALMLKKKLIDITISSEGLQKKITVSADKGSITDSTIGLTVSTDKNELVTLITNLYKEYEAKIASIEQYKLEALKCKSILDEISEVKQKDKQDAEYISEETIKVS